MASLSKPKLIFSVSPGNSHIDPHQSNNNWKLVSTSMNMNELAVIDHFGSTNTSCETEASLCLHPGRKYAPQLALKEDEEIVVGWTDDGVPYIRYTFYQLKRVIRLPSIDGSSTTGSSHWSCIQPFSSDTLSTTASEAGSRRLKVNALADILETTSICSLD